MFIYSILGLIITFISLANIFIVYILKNNIETNWETWGFRINWSLMSLILMIFHKLREFTQ